MHFELQPPSEFSFSQDKEHLLGWLVKTRCVKKQLRGSESDLECVYHVGYAPFLRPARLTTITELNGVVAETGIQEIFSSDSLEGIPLKLSSIDFCNRLERSSISYSVVRDEEIFLYEHWLKLYIEDEELVNITWMNPDYYSELDVIEMAFPSKI